MTKRTGYHSDLNSKLQPILNLDQYLVPTLGEIQINSVFAMMNTH